MGHFSYFHRFDKRMREKKIGMRRRGGGSGIVQKANKMCPELVSYLIINKSLKNLLNWFFCG